MKRYLGLGAIVFLLAGTALAGDPATERKPRRLADRDMDAITAGTDDTTNRGSSGGAIVGNSSTATINKTGHVEVGGSAQQDSRALNLVNSADSGVANGVNVWDGRLDTQTAETTLNVDQANSVVQNMAHSANVPSYIRSEANVDETFKTTKNVSGSGKVDTESVVLGQEIQAGKGFAGAATADLSLTGGQISFSNHIKIIAEGGTGLDIGFGLFGGSITARTEVETTQTLNWILPDLTLHVEGVVCAVAMGSCEAQGTFSETSEGTRSVRSPFELHDASAEYIVVDDSTLDVTADYSVSLAGSAQQNARALNLVNAAGSAIANAVNVARTPTVGPVLNLNQVNVITQGR